MDQFGTAIGRNPDGSVIFDKDQSMGCIIKFYKRRTLMAFKSEQAGHPVYEYPDFIEIISPGEIEKTVVDRAVKPEDKHRFAQQWAQYQAAEEQITEGTPLEHLFPSKPEIVDGLKRMRFMTIEHLAEATDATMQNVPMGGYEWREKAKKYLAFSKDSAKFLKVEKELADKNFRIETLERTIADIQAKMAVDEDAAPPRNKGGRPRRVHIPDEPDDA